MVKSFNWLIIASVFLFSYISATKTWEKVRIENKISGKNQLLEKYKSALKRSIRKNIKS